MLKYFQILLVLISFSDMKGQQFALVREDVKPVNAGYYQLPYVVDSGVILTDEKYSKLYFFSRNMKSPDILLDNQADYRAINISYDKKRIGLLLLTEVGEKIPAVYRVDEKKLEKIGKACHGVSEISFANDNISCYTVDSTIIVIGNKDSVIHTTNFDIDKVQISPDGEHIAVCVRNGKLYILDLDSLKMKLITNEGTGFNPVWSPDGQKLVYSSSLDLVVWDKRCNEKFFIGIGSAPNWSVNSEYIVYQKNNPIKMKFVNADVFISKFNGSEHYQLTNTHNKYEMQPVFGLDNDIYYMTYENRRLIHAKFTNAKFKLSELEVLLEVR